ncbi:MAG TPA: GNAT family N-acetyltransferase [Pseudonocardia sp.]|jgi:hypothetical protein
MTPALTVRNTEESQLYDALVDGAVTGTISYQLAGQRVIMTHTFVEPRFRGQGIATELVRGALDDVRARGKTVSARCEFVVDFLVSHPEYQDLVDPAHPLPAEHR